MANKELFVSSARSVATANSVNNAGGIAYALSDKAALAQYIATGCLSNTFYTSAKDQLDTVLGLVKKVDPEFVAQCAVYSRQKGNMKDMPALLLACLSTMDRNDLFKKTFPKVITDTKMLRNFVQIIRSGVTGRKSLGSMPKRMISDWFNSKSEDQLFNGAIGNDPSLVDVIKLTHPKPNTPERNAFYAYLMGKEHDASLLSDKVRSFELFKKDSTNAIPQVSFERLSNIKLSVNQWKEVAANMSWTQTRMNLNTLQRNGVLSDSKIVKMIADRLINEELILKSKAFPYQLMAAYLNVGNDMPTMITNALQQAMEIATQNIPVLNGDVCVFPDVSGSMSNPVTGYGNGVASKISCYDVAALFAVSILRKNPTARVIPFDTRTHNIKLNPFDSIMTNSQKITMLAGGGTDCSVPLAYLNKNNIKADACIFVSDNESWYDDCARWDNGSGTTQAKEWSKFKSNNKNAKLVCIDIVPNRTTQSEDGSSILNVGGFNDSVFEVVDSFLSSNGKDHWVDVISRISFE